MVGHVSRGARIRRAGLILLAGWLVLEIALIRFAGHRIGWDVTLAILAIKGGVGLILTGFLAFFAFQRMQAGGPDRPAARSIRAGFGVASGVLIALPGFLPPLLGMALLAPRFQGFILAEFFPDAGRQ